MNTAAQIESELTESINVNVSGDGTWKTRGHTLHIGVYTAIGDISRKVTDTKVLSSYC